jgi:hypothetical protein
LEASLELLVSFWSHKIKTLYFFITHTLVSITDSSVTLKRERSYKHLPAMMGRPNHSQSASTACCWNNMCLVLVAIMGLAVAVSESTEQLTMYRPILPMFDEASSSLRTEDELISRRPAAAAAASGSFTRALLLAGTHQRLLQQQQQGTGFEQFNELFADATLSLGDFPVPVMDNLVELNIIDLKCSKIVIGDIITNHTIIQQNGVDVLEFTVTLSPFQFDCTAGYRYKMALFITGEGTVFAEAKGNSLTTKIHIKSASTFEQDPPISSMVDFCEAEIKTDGRVSFQGGVVADIMNGFKAPISDVIDKQAQTGVYY